MKIENTSRSSDKRQISLFEFRHVTSILSGNTCLELLITIVHAPNFVLVSPSRMDFILREGRWSLWPNNGALRFDYLS